MPVKFGFRDKEENHFFKDYMAELFKVPGDAFLLSYGSIDQPKEGGNQNNFGEYNIIPQSDLLGLIKGARRSGELKIITIGNRTYSGGEKYRTFVEKLDNIVGVNVEGLVPDRSATWHAKVAMCLRRTKDGKLTPCATLLGSSNLTEAAYDNWRNWNHETDILVYTPDLAGHFLEMDRTNKDREPSMVTKWDSINAINEQQYMQKLYDDMIEVSHLGKPGYHEPTVYGKKKKYKVLE